MVRTSTVVVVLLGALAGSAVHAQPRGGLPLSAGQPILEADAVLVASGWRPHLWRDYNHYEQTMINRYGSVAEGRKWVAYKSAHETGLAVDFGSHGLEPRRATNERQKQTPFYQWLVNNAHRFGFTPYKVEAWQWEVKVPRDAWASGEEFTNDYGVFV